MHQKKGAVAIKLGIAQSYSEIGAVTRGEVIEKDDANEIYRVHHLRGVKYGFTRLRWLKIYSKAGVLLGSINRLEYS